MAKGNRFKDAKKGREHGGFVALPFVVLRSRSFCQLKAHAVKLLCDLLSQYKGDNNGDLCAAWKLMEARGWSSRDTLAKAKQELLNAGWIVLSRQGGRHQASLFAVTFYAIDECGGKLEIKSTGSPPSTWKLNEPLPPLKPVARPPCQLSEDWPAQRVTEGTTT